MAAMLPWQQQITYSQTCDDNGNGLTMQLEISLWKVTDILWFFWLKTNVEQVILKIFTFISFDFWSLKNKVHQDWHTFCSNTKVHMTHLVKVLNHRN